MYVSALAEADLKAHFRVPILPKPYAWLQTALSASIVLIVCPLMKHAVLPSWQEMLLEALAWKAQAGAVPAPPPALAWDSSC